MQSYFYLWAEDGTLPRINHALVMAAREAAGREASPAADVINSQSVTTTEAGGPRGFDAGKKIKGRKRHIVTDTLGYLVGWLVHPTDVQDRDGAAKTLAALRRRSATNVAWACFRALVPRPVAFAAPTRSFDLPALTSLIVSQPLAEIGFAMRGRDGSRRTSARP